MENATSLSWDRFHLGVNYPWVNYGQDFGRSPWGARGVSTSETRKTVQQDFESMRASGVRVVRWFLLCDGRSGLSSSNGIPTGPDDLLFADVAAALELAQQFNLQLCFSLLDHLWMQESGNTLAATKTAASPAPGKLPHANVLKFPAGREALLETVLIPLFTEFRAHPALYAWEIANEPEWAIHEFTSNAKAAMHFADFRAYAEEIVNAVHEYAEVPVTLGSARLLWFEAWKELGLDIYQAHYYPEAERDQNSTLAQQLKSRGMLDHPLWLGELPAYDPTTPSYALEPWLDECLAAGLAGAAVWRWRKAEPGSPDAQYGSAEPERLRAWLELNGLLKP